MSDPNDFSAMRPLVDAIEQARRRDSKPMKGMGGYLLGVAVGYLQTGGSSDDEIRTALEELLTGD